MLWLLAFLVLATGLTGPAWAQRAAISLPPGFRLEVFASGLGGPRFMTLDPAGTILVSIPGQGRVVALPDRDGDGRADGVVTVAEGLDRPHGLALRGTDLYVAETGRILRLRYDPATMRATEPAVIVPDLPTGGGHWTRTIVLGADDRLYVSVGSSCNVCRERDARRAAILSYRPDGSDPRTFASGLRNAVGLAVHPDTGKLWATVNERDWLGDDRPPDFVTEVKAGGFYGWPDCFVVRGRPVVDTRVEPAGHCPAIVAPTLEIQAHSAPLGLAFYVGRQFPAEYRGSLFVAYHGSWNRSTPTGYKVVRVRFPPGQPPRVEDFATGWLEPSGVVRGRPVGLVVGRDGALYVSSDSHAPDIYRITYRP